MEPRQRQRSMRALIHAPPPSNKKPHSHESDSIDDEMIGVIHLCTSRASMDELRATPLVLHD